MLKAVDRLVLFTVHLYPAGSAGARQQQTGEVHVNDERWPQRLDARADSGAGRQTRLAPTARDDRRVAHKRGSSQSVSGRVVCKFNCGLL
jgi:hypothetical protein